MVYKKISKTFFLYLTSLLFFLLNTANSQTICPISQISIYGKDADDQCGYSVSTAGDFNDDGFTDVLIGARFASPDGINRTGETYIIYGSQNCPSTIDLNNLSGSGVTITGEISDDQLGFSVSYAGDVNGDNIYDIIISATNAEISGKSNTGCVYLLYGNVNFPSTINVSSLQSNGIVISGKNTDDKFGFSISNVGDFNGDGYDDIIIGAPYFSGNGDYHSGESYIILGDDSLPSSIDLSNANSQIITIKLSQENAMFGYDVSSAGDINNDTFDDIIISANSFSITGRNSCGRCFIIYGSENPPSQINPDEIGNGSFSVTGKVAYDFLGTRVSKAGDINKDGFDDILLATTYNNSNEVYIIFGREEPFANVDLNYNYPFVKTIKVDYSDIEQYSIINVCDANDIDKDGFDDIMLSLPSKSSDGLTNNGVVFILNGSDSLPETSILSNYNKLEIKNYTAKSLFGYSISVITDLNKDGFNDIIVGAYKTDKAGKTDCGEARIILLGKNSSLTIPYNIY